MRLYDVATGQPLGPLLPLPNLAGATLEPAGHVIAWNCNRSALLAAAGCGNRGLEQKDSGADRFAPPSGRRLPLSGCQGLATAPRRTDSGQIRKWFAMSDNSKIEWTDATWNPIRGCTKISPGCTHCYAETFAERFRGVPGHPYEQGFDLRLVPEKLAEPLRWEAPKMIFVNSMSDLFHEDVPDGLHRPRHRGHAPWPLAHLSGPNEAVRAVAGHAANGAFARRRNAAYLVGRQRGESEARVAPHRSSARNGSLRSGSCRSSHCSKTWGRSIWTGFIGSSSAAKAAGAHAHSISTGCVRSAAGAGQPVCRCSSSSASKKVARSASRCWMASNTPRCQSSRPLGEPRRPRIQIEIPDDNCRFSCYGMGPAVPCLRLWPVVERGRHSP